MRTTWAQFIADVICGTGIALIFIWCGAPAWCAWAVAVMVERFVYIGRKLDELIKLNNRGDLTRETPK